MSSNSTLIVIPARYASTRLPGKPLADICGKPMVQWVWERCSEVPGCDVVVATDSREIMEVVQGFGGLAAMTNPAASCGTDRMAELAGKVPFNGYATYINVQGDEPLIQPTDIQSVMQVLAEHPTADVATLFYPVCARDAARPEAVKAVVAPSGQCLYFSRSLVPYSKAQDAKEYSKHVGIYGYRKAVLQVWPSLRMGVLEQQESLEQLRLLEAGLRIFAKEVAPTGPGVDTPETLEEVRHIMAGGPQPRKKPLIRLVATDIDGALTDGGVFFGGDGNCAKRFDIRDGLGFVLLHQAGVTLAAISGRKDSATQYRLDQLQVPQNRRYLGVADKGAVLLSLMQELKLSPEECAYLGDDLIDLPAFERVEHSAAPFDALAVVREKARHKLSACGGQGAFRELADLVLKNNGHQRALESAEGYLSFMQSAPITPAAS